jgi:hypothetical protein
MAERNDEMNESKDREYIAVESWTSEVGAPSSMYQLVPGTQESRYAAAVAALRERGCGAWRGRTACGEPATWVAFGGVGLYFQTYRTVHSRGSLVLAAFCDRHAGPLWQVTRDMPRPLRRTTERQIQEGLRRLGATNLEGAAREVMILPLDDPEPVE